MTPVGILLIVVSALIHSSWNFFTKRGNWPLEFFFWVFFVGPLLYLPFFLLFDDFPGFILQMNPKLWGLIISSGLLQAVYMVCLIKAYRTGDLSLVYPISRSAPLFTQIWAVFFIGEVLSGQGVTGIGLVMIGLFLISLRNLPMRRHDSVLLPPLLAFVAALTSSIYSVIDKVGVQNLHPVFYLWFLNLWIGIFIALYLFVRKEGSLLQPWRESKREILIIAVLQNAAYLLVLLALQMSKVSYVVAFRQVGALFGAGMGILFLKERHWKTRIAGALILTFGLVLVGLAN